MECEFNGTHIKEDLTTTRSMSISQPRSVKGVHGDHLQDEVRQNSKTSSEVLGRLQYSTTKSSGLVRPGPIGLYT
jgi:hypothetical protein